MLSRGSVYFAGAVLAASSLLVACDGKVTADAHSSDTSAAVITASPSSGGGQPSTATSGGQLASAAPPPASARAAAGTPACSYTALTPDGAAKLEANNAVSNHSYDVMVGFSNSSRHSCVIEGFPTVAIAGQGDPSRNQPLKVTHAGITRPVRLAPGNRAYLRLTFNMAWNDAGEYCLSGATPATPPSLVIGAAGGRLQVEMSERYLPNFDECDDVVRTTAFLSESDE
ncbi:DUF4232 domain-containing protein [Streptomyces sp. NPDC056661]|uniref:DUF4232 domain-containing protein n=1 Tax=Streptomyces sp. NPDC056661 TaxID=3345898 RepID=UPI0036CFF42C